MVAASNLACDQACLTGESDAVNKVAEARVAMDAVLQVSACSGAAIRCQLVKSQAEPLALTQLYVTMPC